MGDFWQDLRYGLRILGRHPGFAVIAGLTLALGIGGNTALFTVVHAVLIKPLPYPQADRLVWFQPANLRTGEAVTGSMPISPPDFADYRDQSTLFDHAAAYVDNPVNLTLATDAERLPGATVSRDFFETLGVRPIYGRTFRDEDEQVNVPETAILSYGLWQSRFGGDPGVVGKAITLDDRSTTVIGILPRSFRFPAEAELWRPLPLRNAVIAVRRFHFVHVIGRLKPGVTLAQAQSEVTAISLRLEKQYPDTNADSGVKLLLLQDQLVGHVKSTLTVLMVAVGFVLLIGCVNVASLLLANAASREKEIVIRTSVGASPLRLVLQLLTESVLLSALSGALGLLLGYAGVRVLLAFNAGYIPRVDEIRLDPTVLGFTAGLSILTGLIFGIVPALKAVRLNLTETLKEGSHSVSGGAYGRTFHRVLVAGEVALALVLLAGAGLFLRTFDRLQKVDPGFNPSGVLSMEIQIPFKSATDGPKWAEFFRQLVARIQSLAGVQSVGIVSELPLSGIDREATFTIEGQAPPAPGHEPWASVRRVSPDYFKTMGIPLRQGRLLTDLDNENGQRVVIISEAFAREFFPHGDAIGQRLTFPFDQPWTGMVVGVVGDIHHDSLARSPGRDVYLPEAQSPFNGVDIVVRSSLSPSALTAAVKQQVRAVSPNLPVYKIRTMDQLISDSFAPARFRTLLMGIFALLALVLAVAGIYGVTSYSVSRRAHEMGIRMAVGAQPRDVLLLVVKQEMAPALFGAWIGVLASLGMARLVTALLFEVSPADPATFGAVALLLILVAFVASYVPARRAARVDPMVALRYE